MKDYKEMAESVLQRRDVYVAQKKRRRKEMAKIGGTVLSLAIVCMVGFTAYQNQQTADSNETGIAMMADQAMQRSVTYNAEAQDMLEYAPEECAEGVAENVLADGAEDNAEKGSVEHPKNQAEEMTAVKRPKNQEEETTAVERPKNQVEEVTANPPEKQQETEKNDTSENKFSQQYLNQVLAEISEDMVAGLLPYVCYAGVDEPGNCICIRVLTESISTEQEEQLTAYGQPGAIRIELADALINNFQEKQ